MKSLVVVDSLNGVKNNLGIFNHKNIEIITFDFIASEFLKKNIKKNSKNIFDFYNKEERLKIFYKSIKVLNSTLNNLDKNYSGEISKILRIKKIPIYKILFQNILFYEFFTIFYLRKVLKKIFKKNYKKVIIIRNENRNNSKIFNIEEQIKKVAYQNKVSDFTIVTNDEAREIKDIFYFLLKIAVNYKKLFELFNGFFEKKYLEIKNYKNKKYCLSFFNNNLIEKIILQKGYKLFLLGKIKKIVNQKMKSKIFLLLKKKINNDENTDQKTIIKYLSKNLNYYFDPLINFLNFSKIKKLNFAIWSRPVVNIYGYNLVLEYLLKKKLKVIGRQHGANYIDCISQNQHFDMDFNRCTEWLSFGANESTFKKTYGFNKKLCKIIPAGNENKLKKNNLEKKIDILFPIQSLNDFINSRPIEKELFINHKLILSELNKRKKNSVCIKPGLGMKNSISEEYLFKNFKNLKINQYYSLKKYLKIYSPNLIILDWYSTPLYEILELDVDIFIINESVEKISNYAKKKLKKRVFIFENIKSLTKAIKNYDSKKIKKLRDKSFYKTYVNNGDLKSTLEKII